MTSATSEPARLDPKSRSILKVIFVTLFIDLIGFSIIFPLFPGMLDYYRAVEPPGSLFHSLYGALQGLSDAAGAPNQDYGIMVLFGGVLGSIYSLLQFLCAPMFGAISDRVGRKPVLTVALFGILASYALWFLAGSFFLLVLARFIGGIMAANISTATAIVADVTTDRTRAKGMAIIGIAFGVGFIVGPAIGGISAALDLSKLWPAGAAWGINPYSMPAAVAFLLTAFNIILVIRRLPETRERATAPLQARRTANPLAFLRTEGLPGVSRTNLIYFLFLFAFSGMEFSLTFLTVDRLGYDTRQNTYMFLFIGLVLTFVQGGYVQRRSHAVGSRRMAMQGLLIIIPGLALIGLAGWLKSGLALYVGLFGIAVGSALATPCLTALVSLYAPLEEQGRVMGIFRSMGALARALGPFAACILCWRLGFPAAYLLSALFLFVPLLLGRALPQPVESA